jgi:bifunctional DNA-binding transcriptional regulator/antitoxin component of YhaV-PrlF toxin-antitoxin module
VVIPSDVRRTLAINPGDSMCVLTKHGKAIAMIKMDDLDEFMAFMREEMSAIKAMTLEQAKRNQPTTPITQP